MLHPFLLPCSSLLVLTLVLLDAHAGIAAEEKDEGFISLFDGKTLEGWEGREEMFRVEAGAIVAGSLKHPIAHNEFLCTRKAYGDFELRLKAKLVGQGKNAGIQFRSRRIPDHHEVIGYQCDMGRSGDQLIWGALYDESRRRRMLDRGENAKLEEVYRSGDWNEFVIRCEGGRIQIWLNGYQTVDFLEPDDSVSREGILGLQIHGGPPAEAWYKDIRIKELK